MCADIADINPAATGVQCDPIRSAAHVANAACNIAAMNLGGN